MKLASTKTIPPNGFLFEQTHTGWKNWVSSPNSVWDFELLCQELLAHRQANHAQFPYLSLDINQIRKDVEFVNAIRISKIAGAESYLDRSGGQAVTFHPPHSPNLPGGAVGEGIKTVKKLAAGAGAIMDLLDTNEFVEQDLAEKRAAHCVKCPEMGSGSLLAFFTEPIAKMIKRKLEARKELNLKTKSDSKLHTCKACLCPMKLKVHAPLAFIKSHMSDQVLADLHPDCWIRHE